MTLVFKTLLNLTVLPAAAEASLCQALNRCGGALLPGDGNAQPFPA